MGPYLFATLRCVLDKREGEKERGAKLFEEWDGAFTKREEYSKEWDSIWAGSRFGELAMDSVPYFTDGNGSHKSNRTWCTFVRLNKVFAYLEILHNVGHVSHCKFATSLWGHCASFKQAPKAKPVSRSQTSKLLRPAAVQDLPHLSQHVWSGGFEQMIFLVFIFFQKIKITFILCIRLKFLFSPFQQVVATLQVFLTHQLHNGRNQGTSMALFVLRTLYKMTKT